MATAVDIGSRLRALRKERQLTLSQLAAKSSLSPSLISQAERNRLSPSIAALEALAEALGVPIVRFFQEDPPSDLVVRAASDVPWRVLLSEGMGTGFNAFVQEVGPRKTSELRLGGSSGEELGFIIRGSV